MSELQRKSKIKYLQLFRNGKWLLNVYLIQSDVFEDIEDAQVNQLIESYLDILEKTCISDEFEYYRTGFAFLHYGNRGVDLTIWHYGRWGETFETYSCSWYCYGRETSNMELLDSAEPVMCQYEIIYIIDEFKAICEILKKKQDICFRKRYIEYFSIKQ